MATSTHEKHGSLEDVRSLTYKVIPISMLLLLVAFITCTLIYTLNLERQIPAPAAIAISILFGFFLLLFGVGALILHYSNPSPQLRGHDPERGNISTHVVTSPPRTRGELPAGHVPGQGFSAPGGMPNHYVSQHHGQAMHPHHRQSTDTPRHGQAPYPQHRQSTDIPRQDAPRDPNAPPPAPAPFNHFHMPDYGQPSHPQHRPSADLPRQEAPGPRDGLLEPPELQRPPQQRRHGPLHQQTNNHVRRPSHSRQPSIPESIAEGIEPPRANPRHQPQPANAPPADPSRHPYTSRSSHSFLTVPGVGPGGRTAVNGVKNTLSGPHDLRVNFARTDGASSYAQEALRQQMGNGLEHSPKNIAGSECEFLGRKGGVPEANGSTAGKDTGTASVADGVRKKWKPIEAGPGKTFEDVLKGHDENPVLYQANNVLFEGLGRRTSPKRLGRGSKIPRMEPMMDRTVDREDGWSDDTDFEGGKKRGV